MSPNFKHALFFFVAIGCAALLQRTGMIAFGGVTPNWVLAFLLTAIVFIDDVFFFEGLALWASGLIKFYPGIDVMSIGLFATGNVLFYLKRSVSWRSGINVGIFIVVGTLFFNALVDIQFVKNHLDIIGLEVIYNLVGGYVAYFLARFL